MPTRPCAYAGAILLVSACSSSAPPQPAPFEPIRRPVAVEPPPASVDDAGAPGPTTDLDAGSASGPRVVIETPFKLDARPIAGDREAFLAELHERTRWNEGGMGELASDPPPVEGHPMPRVIVDITHATGQKSAADVQRIMRAKFWIRVIECYRLGAYKNQKLRGEATIKFTITPGGKPKPGKAASAKLPDAEVVDCLADQVKVLDFGKARAGTAVIARIQIGAGDEPMPPPDSAVKPGDGVLTTDKMKASIEAALADITACYQSAIAYAPGLWGRLAIRFHVGDRGKVDEAFEVESHFPDERVSRCVLHVARRLQFEKPAGGDLRFVVALRFSSDKSVTE